MSKEQFKGMLQSFLIKVNRANLPLALNDYSAHLSNLFKAKDQRIAELEEQLKNAIVPKFKIGDKVYAIIDTFAYTDVLPIEIRDTHLLYEVWDGQDTTKQHYTRIFATKDEALVKLEELRGE